MKFFEKANFFVAGVVVAAVVMPGVMTLGNAVTRQITVASGHINIVVNGRTVNPQDAHGSPVEPFVFEGTTFVPVRTIADIAGLTPSWDGSTSTVYLDSVADIGATPALLDPPESQRQVFGDLSFELPAGWEILEVNATGIQIRSYARGLSVLVFQLMERHMQHHEPYIGDFTGMDYILFNIGKPSQRRGENTSLDIHGELHNRYSALMSTYAAQVGTAWVPSVSFLLAYEDRFTSIHAHFFDNHEYYFDVLFDFIGTFEFLDWLR